MAYNVIFTLTSAGLDSGPFNISGTTSSNTTILIASNVSKSTLQAGYEVTISDDNVTGGTVASTGVCTNTQPWVKPTGATPTPTPGVSAECWSLTYSSVPSDLYVRYRNEEDVVTTRLIQNIPSMDNGNGTYTAYICVSLFGSYSSPTCVQGSQTGTETICDPYIWTNEGVACTNENTCLLN